MLDILVCIPLVFLLMILTLGICSDIFLKETLTVAAFEGARAGVRRRATVNHALQQAENVLEARGVVDGTVTIVPSNFSNLNALDEITVIVSAPISGNSFFGYNPLNPTRYASAQVVMVREFDD